MQTLIKIWDFFQNQVLGMKWLNSLIGHGLNGMGLSVEDTTGYIRGK